MAQRKAADSPTKNCTASDCDRPLRARGLCHMHWKREYGKRKYVEVACPTCGVFTTKRDDGASTRRFCSLLCRDIWRIDQPDDPMYLRTGHEGRRGPRLCRLPSSHPVMWVGRSSPVVFGPCGWCGQPTCRGENGTRAYCSKTCRGKASKCRRRGREAQDFGYWTWFDFMHIARRFDYRCAYCHVKPECSLQPDHVVPVSKGGPNTVANLLPACLHCNADKRDLLLHEWAADRAVRGKPALATSWAPEDRRYRHLTSVISRVA